jgi:sugar lactone lactonase YvrE
VIFSPTATKTHELVFTAKAITCPTFGGENLDTVFVTSAKSKNGEEGDEGGNLFRLQIPEEWGVKGVERGVFDG